MAETEAAARANNNEPNTGRYSGGNGGDSGNGGGYATAIAAAMGAMRAAEAVANVVWHIDKVLSIKTLLLW